MDVVIDGITCIQQRKDPEFGSQDLNTWAWVLQGCGAIVGSGIGGLIVQYWVPRYAFFAYAAVSFSGSMCSYYLSPALEDTNA